MHGYRLLELFLCSSIHLCQQVVVDGWGSFCCRRRSWGRRYCNRQPICSLHLLWCYLPLRAIINLNTVQCLAKNGLFTFLVMIVSDTTMLAYSALLFLRLKIVGKVLPKGGSTASSRCSGPAVGSLVDSSVYCCISEGLLSSTLSTTSSSFTSIVERLYCSVLCWYSVIYRSAAAVLEWMLHGKRGSHLNKTKNLILCPETKSRLLNNLAKPN